MRIALKIRLAGGDLRSIFLIPLFILLYWMPLAAAPRQKFGRTQIKVPLWLEFKAGEATNPLSVEDLHATLEGAPARVLGLRRPGDDLMLLIVLDLEEDQTFVAPAKEALITGIEQLPGCVYTGLLRAQDGLRLLMDPTRDRSSLAAAIESAPASGKAGLLDTLEMMEQIADSILAKSGVRVSVLYITDSNIRNYREDFANPVINASDPHDLSRRFPEELVREKIAKLDSKLETHETPVFIVHVHDRSDRLNEAYENGLKQLAETTGGASAFCRSVGEIPTAISEMIETIASHYSVSLELPSRPPTAFEVRLKLAGAGHGHPNLTYRSHFALK